MAKHRHDHDADVCFVMWSGEPPAHAQLIYVTRFLVNPDPIDPLETTEDPPLAVSPWELAPGPGPGSPSHDLAAREARLGFLSRSPGPSSATKLAASMDLRAPSGGARPLELWKKAPKRGGAQAPVQPPKLLLPLPLAGLSFCKLQLSHGAPTIPKFQE